MKAFVRFDTQIVGALPVILSYFDKLHVAATVDQLVPWEGEVPWGVLAEILMANRLLQPKAMVRIGQWAGRVGLTDYYGLTVEELNDDRLGRALERLTQYGDTVEIALTLRAIKVFKVRVDQIHYDLTSAELFGAYEQMPTEGAEPPTPLPAYRLVNEHNFLMDRHALPQSFPFRPPPTSHFSVFTGSSYETTFTSVFCLGWSETFWNSTQR